jgi:hypothetical protein
MCKALPFLIKVHSEMSTKVCKTCNVCLDIAEFEKTDAGHRNDCKKCKASKKKASLAASKAANPLDMSTFKVPEKCDNPECKAVVLEFVFRDDIQCGGYRSTCKACISVNAKKKQFSQNSRARSLAKDPVAYRARNTATHRVYVANNPDVIRGNEAHRKSASGSKIKDVVTYAKKKGIEFQVDDTAALKEMLSLACEYCGYLPAHGQPLNGLDRVDPNGIYSADNCVPCCALCNAMKLSYTVDEFVAGVRSIAAHCGLVYDPHASAEIVAFGGTKERRDAGPKDKEDKLSADERLKMMCDPCYLCGQTPSYGVDRCDASVCYTLENSMQCCTQCNYMKKDLALEDFTDHIARIQDHTKGLDIPPVHGFLRHCNGMERSPVMASNGAIRVVFPSVNTASIMCRVSENSIKTLRVTNGFKWSFITHAEFLSSLLSTEDTFRVVTAIVSKASTSSNA